MSLLGRVRDYHEKRITVYRHVGLIKGELLNLLHRRNEWKNIRLSPEEKKRAKEFYRKYYGRTVPLFWHRLYKSYTGVFDEKYFPEILFSARLEDKLNPYRVAAPLENKAFIPQKLFSNLDKSMKIRVPYMYCMDLGGTKWDSNGRIISEKEALDILENGGEKEVIIKPVVDTMGGANVSLLKLKDGKDLISGKSCKEIFSKYGQNYIVQERVRNHPSISRLYDKSINTIRVITFVADNKINVAPLAMRIGVSGRVVDNGGIFIGVSEDGSLNSVGYSKKGIVRYDEHPDTKVKFEGYKIEGVPERIEAAKQLHGMIPQLKMLSWDMAFDEEGNVVVIEVNTTGQSVWFPQMVTGKSIFGEYTGEMLKLMR